MLLKASCPRLAGTRTGPWLPGAPCSNARLCDPALPTGSPHSDGDAGAAVTVPLVLAGPAPHEDVAVLELLCSLCRQPRATLPA